LKKPISVFSFHIQNATEESVDIHIDGDIVDASTQAVIKAIFGDSTTTSYKSFRNEIDKVKAKTYNVIINSVGGHVGDAMAIHDLLIDLQAKGKTVNTIGRGIVASSATLILMAGKNPEMSANSWFMMHTVSSGVHGTVDQVENYAVTMRKFNDSIRDLYAEKSGMRKEEVTKLMNAETWLSANEAKDKGLIASVTGSVAFQNLISKEQWDYSNTAVLNSYNSSVKQTSQLDDMKKLITDWGTNLMNAIKGISVTDKTTQQELLNSISEQIGSSAAQLGTSLEPAVNEAVTAAFASKPVQDAIALQVTNQVTAATKGMVTKADYDAKVAELEGEIVNKVGGQSQGSRTEKQEVVIGEFN
jgi:ATP-dependent Clp protease, protease subunit